VRTFALVGLTGGVAGALSLTAGPLVLGLLFVGFAASFAPFQLLEARTDQDLSATLMIAGLLVFALGTYAVVGDMQVAAACGVAMTILLALRQQLHGWIRGLKWAEFKAVLVSMAMTLLLLPVLPDHPVDPWQALHPRELWLFAILIAGISFGGHVAIRVLGDRLGVVLASVAGGIASSTATTMALSRLARADPDAWPILVAGILTAGAVMMVRVELVVSVLNRSIGEFLIFPILAAVLVQTVGAFVLAFRKAGRKAPLLKLSNPLEVGTALKLALLMAAVLLAGKLLQYIVGSAGLLALAAASGIADVDAATVSITGMNMNEISPLLTACAMGLAVAVNTIS
jgi:uncharacterized membrane protein (DUF4010 family)